MSDARRYYVLFILLLTGMTSYLDRQVLTILLEPIRHEFSLTDSQIGLVTGLAFTIVYVTLTIPAARLADVWSRRKVIAWSVATWSLMTVFCGMAQNFLQLFLARVGVGVGEGGGAAPAHAYVGDLFPRERRATALSVLFLSVPLGTAVGLLWGGWAVGEFGWRIAFILAGVPGLILAPLIIFTIPETPKGMADGVSAPLPAPPFRDVVRLLWSIRSLRNMMFATSCSTLLSLGVMAWVPSFLARSHGMSPSAIGSNMALVLTLAFTFGTMLGGRLLDLLGRRDMRAQFWMATIGTFTSGIFAAAFFQAPAEYIFILLGAQQFFGSLFTAGLVAVTQNLVPVATRATISGCLLFVIYTIGVGLGPQAVGIASDLLRPTYGEESLRFALFGATSFALLAAFFHFRASLTYRDDLAEAARRNQAAWSGTSEPVRSS